LSVGRRKGVDAVFSIGGGVRGEKRREAAGRGKEKRQLSKVKLPMKRSFV